jgi:hypothetical protein
MYRGVVTFGEAAIEENFVVGPAVDEAAEAMNAAQGALVWLTPSALGVFRPSEPAVHPLVGYEVPLKGGDRLPSYCVNPFEPTESAETIMRLRDAAAGSFTGTGSLDVAVKKNNTLHFLDAAAGAIARFHEARL